MFDPKRKLPMPGVKPSMPAVPQSLPMPGPKRANSKWERLQKYLEQRPTGAPIKPEDEPI